jgi:DNA repair exonuclease SbcCD nuclease subunit
MSGDVRILLLADSHLGFDLPVRPRSGRRRRGYDFLSNYATALEPALRGEVDLVVHAGDVFDRPSVVSSIAYQAYQPLKRVADAGVPVFIVPGNHERSRLPHALLASHPSIHVFDRPRTIVAEVRGTPVAFSGFPYERREVRTRFAHLLESTEWRGHDAAYRLLCIHHCVEGATVGPANFTFATAADVIRLRDIPGDFSAVLSGHIHRHQVLMANRGSASAPVLYPGSIERTSFAEMDEPKGFMVVRLGEVARDVRWERRPLPARPMVRRDIDAGDMSASRLGAAIRCAIADASRDAVLSIRIAGVLSPEHRRAFSAARLRDVIPPTMNIEVVPVDGFVSRERLAARGAERSASAQLSLYAASYP